MDLPAITPTLKLFNDIQVLHLEPTDICQASCPQCARETDTTFNKKIQRWLTVENIQNILSDSFISNLDKMFMCGNYGDPAAGQALEIIDYFRKVNNDISIGIHSNGGLRSKNWWYQLGTRLNQERDYAVFSIDGLENTNHIYRVNVVWNKVIENAKSFIDAGGKAHWEMIIFEHNEHQVDEVATLAKKLGFKILRYKVSKRHNEYPVSWIKPPKSFEDSVIATNEIKCHALAEKSIYMSTQGKLHPCCWLGSNNGILLNDFDKIKESWKTSPNDICVKTCSIKNLETNFTKQWRKEIILNP